MISINYKSIATVFVIVPKLFSALDNAFLDNQGATN